MLKRKILEKITQWKKTKYQKCLLIKGARQIGKTYIIDKFGRENYKSYIYINFVEHPDYISIFDGSLAAEDIYKKISLNILPAKFIENDTLIFLDEIQVCPNARTALKFLAIDNKYDIIASGSLLGIRYKEIVSIPVGYETQIEMHSLDFEEFLWAIGMTDQTINYVKTFFDNLEKIPYTIHMQMMKHLREYAVIGGMPAVVNRYLETKNYGDAYEMQKEILTSYLDDIAKYASIAEKQKIENCYLSIPKQLEKEYKKFQFGKVEKGSSARKYAGSLKWLRDANLIRFCFNVSSPTFPLIAYERDKQFKIYLNDIGLLVAMYGFDIKKKIHDDSLIGNAKGGVYENLIADIFIKKDYRLNYYKDDNNTQEIEFLLTRDDTICPIEVKASNGASISLNTILKNPNITYGYKLISGNIGQVGKKITLPLYMALFI